MFARRDLIFGLLLSLVACKGSQRAPAPSASETTETGVKKADSISLTGAGATFPYPLYSKWISEYNKLNPGVKINYQSIGSGGGIRQISANTVDFGATDAPMKEEEAKNAPGKLFHIPATIGAVVVAYNLPEFTGTLKLTPEVLVGIYSGKIRMWNDAKIKADNAGAKLPAKDISVVYRTDGSGTTAVFTDYLAKVSPEWKEKVGVGKAVNWPTGLGAKGNEGVTGQVKTTAYTIGYIERAYASQNKLPMAELKNKAGKFVAPTIEAMSAAADAVEVPEELFVSLADAEGDTVYPITSYSYLLVYEDAKDPVKGEALAKYLWWGLHEGQKFSKDLDYAPIPAKVLAKVEARLKELRSGDKKLLSGA
ncbi:MAG TPA: phosphate ABC transporter substrate-binding protein PstS [Polyangiaceae bacterium]|nr:phosphate ABC transporter substrate-binding protein PstS [Polyangiaceae bacterium]